MLRGGITVSIALLCAFGAVELRAEAGAALQGAAAIVGAAAPIGVAAAQAGADKYMSALSAEVAMYQTDRYSQVSEFQGKLQQETALAMAGLQYAVNGYNQMQSTNRLQMQLDAIARSSALTQQMSSDSLKREYSLLNRQLDVQSKALDQQFKLASYQSGAYTLFATINSGSQLPTRYNITRPSKSTQAASDRLLSNLGSNPNIPTTSTNTPVSESSLGSNARVTTTQSSLVGGSVRGRIGTLPSTAMRRPFSNGTWPRHSARGIASEAGHGHHHGHSEAGESGAVIRLGR